MEQAKWTRQYVVVYEIKEAKRVQEKLRIYVEVKPWLANDN